MNTNLYILYSSILGSQSVTAAIDCFLDWDYFNEIILTQKARALADNEAVFFTVHVVSDFFRLNEYASLVRERLVLYFKLQPSDEIVLRSVQRFMETHEE